MPGVDRNPNGTDKKVVTLIELPTFAILAPSDGATHPSGRPYVRQSGDFTTIASVTTDERDALIALARTFDEMPRPEARPPSTVATAGTRPGDDYNRRALWPEILEPVGWTGVYERGGETFWRRPGKTIGISATTNFGGSDLFYPFTSSTEFEADKSYSKFAVYTVLHHGGDFAAAARALSRQGYGERAAEPEPPREQPPVEPRTLAEADVIFRRWLGDEYDLDALHVVLATAAAEQLSGDPAWLLLVAGSGFTKTETVQALAGADAIVTSTVA